MGASLELDSDFPVRTGGPGLAVRYRLRSVEVEPGAELTMVIRPREPLAVSEVLVLEVGSTFDVQGLEVDRVSQLAVPPGPRGVPADAFSMMTVGESPDAVPMSLDVCRPPGGAVVLRARNSGRRAGRLVWELRGRRVGNF